jgi:hypothetical protein
MCHALSLETTAHAVKSVPAIGLPIRLERWQDADRGIRLTLLRVIYFHRKSGLASIRLTKIAPSFLATLRFESERDPIQTNPIFEQYRLNSRT